MPESPSMPSRDELLENLNLKISKDEASNQLHLTKTLEQCIVYAQARGLTALDTLLQNELNGYSHQVPVYRNANLSYFDHGGQYIEGLEKYSRYPVITGVRKLELHLKNGLTLMLPKPILNFLSQQAGREVATGHISCVEIQQLLDAAKQEVITYL